MILWYFILNVIFMHGKVEKKLIIVYSYIEDFFFIEKNKERLLFEWKDSEENCII